MFGYMGKLCRINLETREISYEYPDEKLLRQFLGSAGLGTYYLYKEVGKDVKWSDPENLLMIMSGPLGGAPGPTGTVSVVTKGALTGAVGSAQTNGKMGAFLKFCGFDGLMITGISKTPVYLHISEEKVEFRDAAKLMGLDAWETNDVIDEELGMDEITLSVMAIGPAGEHGVHLAATCTERGHMSAHNGVGAIFGAKNLKAVAVERGTQEVPFADRKAIHDAFRKVLEEKSIPSPNRYYQYGTSRAIITLDKAGMLPIKNYQECDGQPLYYHDGVNYEEYFEKEHVPCWGCMFKHCHRIKVKDGKYKGIVGEEQEYEGVSGLGTNIMMGTAVEAQLLGNVVDKLCMDANEMGWILGWLMECYDRGVCTKEDLGGLEMTWGNYDACCEMVRRIAYRETEVGDALANGLAYAAPRLWNGAGADYGVYTLKGNTPRGHDHRQTFNHLLDTCTGGIGTDEIGVLFPNNVVIGLPADTDKTTPDGCAKIVAACYRKGVKTCMDTFPMCFCGVTSCDHHDVHSILRAAVMPAWDIDEEELSTICMRISTLIRSFGIRNAGVTPEQEWPSKRYASAVMKGPLAGKCFMDIYGETLTNFYREMGWDEATGKPLPETLRALGLDFVIDDLWVSEAADHTLKEAI